MSVSDFVQNDIDAHLKAQASFSSKSYGSEKDKSNANFNDCLDAVAMEPTPKLRRQKGMTYRKLCERIRLGFGQGHGRNYRPWLQLRRKNPSPLSNQVVTWLPPLGRVAHFFSRGEYHTALLLLWLMVLDLREQYPIWPIAHPHPLEGTCGTEHMRLGWSQGLLKIAQDAGIDHGFEFGSKQPYVATLDIVVTARLNGQCKLATFSSKPIIDPSDDVKWRTLERLELERRYAAEIKSTYFVSSSALIPLMMAGQLEWWLDCSTLACQPQLLSLSNLFSDHINGRNDLSVAEAVTTATQAMSISLEYGWLLFRHCAWTQKIDIDPSKPVLTSYPIRRGGRLLRKAIQQQLFGESWS